MVFNTNYICLSIFNLILSETKHTRMLGSSFPHSKSKKNTFKTKSGTEEASKGGNQSYYDVGDMSFLA